jgi:hypothetical protein
MENMENAILRRCIFHNVLGNAVFLSGHSLDVSVSENYIHHVGVHGIVVAGKEIFVLDTHGAPKNVRLEFSRAANVSNNIIHDVGTLYRHSAAVLIAGSKAHTCFKDCLCCILLNTYVCLSCL